MIHPYQSMIRKMNQTKNIKLILFCNKWAKSWYSFVKICFQDCIKCSIMYQYFWTKAPLKHKMMMMNLKRFGFIIQKEKHWSFIHSERKINCDKNGTLIIVVIKEMGMEFYFGKEIRVMMSLFLFSILRGTILMWFTLLFT